MEDETSVVTEGSELLEKDVAVFEKISRKESFGRATLVVKPLAPTSADTALSKEHSEQGQVKRDVYNQYIRAASIFGFLVFIVVSVGQLIATIGGNLVLRAWGEHNQENGENSGLNAYLIGYGLFSLTAVVLGGIGSILMWVLIALRTAKYFHDTVSLAQFNMMRTYLKYLHQMLHAVMRAPLSFFEVTPTGR